MTPPQRVREAHGPVQVVDGRVCVLVVQDVHALDGQAGQGETPGNTNKIITDMMG